MKKARLICFVLCGTAGACWAAEDCDVSVSVRDGKGRQVQEPVRVVRANGEALPTIVSVNGTAEFCDVGLGEFSVVVGRDSFCGQVTLGNLRAVWPATLRLSVVYDNCHRQMLSLGCAVLLHVTSEDGLPITGAVLRENGVLDVGIVSDRFGRIRTALGFGENRSFEVSVERGGAARVNVHCDRRSPEIEDKLIIQGSEGRL